MTKMVNDTLPFLLRNLAVEPDATNSGVGETGLD
jgi:hypothetical protein